MRKETSFMSLRYKTITKVGKGQYITSNNSIGSYIIYNLLYWIFITPFYIIIKYCIYLPIKWCVVKIIKLINNNYKKS